MVICLLLLKDDLLPAIPVLGKLLSNTWEENIKFKTSPPMVYDEALPQKLGWGI